VKKKKNKKGIGKLNRQGLATASHRHLCGVMGEVGFELPRCFVLYRRRIGEERRTIMAACGDLELR
jgi:hypothetical protein